jgi:hypothetical protein
MTECFNRFILRFFADSGVARLTQWYQVSSSNAQKQKQNSSKATRVWCKQSAMGAKANASP